MSSPFRIRCPVQIGLGVQCTPDFAIEFLKAFANQEDFTYYDSVFGSLELTENEPIKQSSGAVYGVWVKSETILNNEVKSIPNYPKWYPVYWGKDIKPISRISAHVQNHKGTGNAKLRAMQLIKDKPIIFGALFVERYNEFERLVHQNYPALKGAGQTGKNSSIIQIMN